MVSDKGMGLKKTANENVAEKYSTQCNSLVLAAPQLAMKILLLLWYSSPSKLIQLLEILSRTVKKSP